MVRNLDVLSSQGCKLENKNVLKFLDRYLQMLDFFFDWKKCLFLQ